MALDRTSWKVSMKISRGLEEAVAEGEGAGRR